MTISVVIPTLNRPDDLIRALKSIEANTVRPMEVIIIDQGQLNPDQLRGIDLRLELVRIDKKSLTQAENIGVEIARGEIVSILDDDVILEKEYFDEVLKSFNRFSDVQIVQGKITNFQTRKTREFFWSIFIGSGSLWKSNFVRSANFVSVFYKSNADTEQFCMWASGCNQNIRKAVFAHEKFDSQLLRYSAGEDLDFSYRIFIRYGSRSILFQPKAKLAHIVSVTGRISGFNKTITKNIHLAYFRVKNICTKMNFIHKFAYGWYLVGQLLFALFKFFKGDRNAILFFCISEYQLIKHHADIRNLDLEWLNQLCFNECSKPHAQIIGKWTIEKNYVSPCH